LEAARGAGRARADRGRARGGHAPLGAAPRRVPSRHHRGGGRYDQAIALLEGGLATLGPDRVARRPRALSDLAAAHARQGSVDHACDPLVEASMLARRAGLSDRIPRIIAVRDRFLAAHAAEPAVRRLDELVRAH
jgi:hypothetical protein